MSIMETLLGEWHADLDRWQEVDPAVAELGSIFAMMMGDLKVTFTADTMTTEGSGKGPAKVDTYQVTSESPEEVVMDVFRGERKAVFAIEIADDQHILLRMREPKADVMALKR
ncbi:MAG: hypothetical protein JW797_04035 [Bradymonadales bacterium]|nr:hypothetical protein [Bradymonadales bacterium]